MSLRIWETDPDAKPRPRDRFTADVVGYIHGGMVVRKKPVALSEWRFTSDDPAVATRLADLYGGSVEEWDTDKDNNLQVLSTTGDIRLLLDDPDALRSRMVQWGRTKPIHTCDGMYFLDGENRGELCGCPAEFSARKAAADAETGPKPDIALKARLADSPELGYFVYRTTSWSLVRDLHDVEYNLAEAADGGHRILLSLRLEHVAFQTKKGQNVEFYRPVMDNIAAEEVPDTVT